MKTIRWGIIGVGDVTEVKSGPAFYKAAHSELVAVMRRTTDRARDYAARHNVPRWYDDAQALIDDPDVDAVYIATPPDSHKDYTLRVAAAGKPVYCEKPMALNYTECQEMVTACDQAGVPLWVAYYRRTLPRFVKIKALLDSGAIGDVQAVTIRLHKRPGYTPGTPVDEVHWKVRPEVGGGGIFVDMGSHTWDFLDFLLGPISDVSGYASNLAGLYPAEDNVGASFKFASGVTGSGSWCFNSFEEVDDTVLLGTHGKLSFSTFDTAPFTLTTADDVQTFDIPNPEHVHQPLIETILAELNGQGTCPSTGESAARTNRVMDAILADYYQQSPA